MSSRSALGERKKKKGTKTKKRRSKNETGDVLVFSYSDIGRIED
jgi:hypothetical protein